MANFNRKEYMDYRRIRKDDDDYFPEGTEHEYELFSVEDKLFIWDKAKNESNIAIHGIDFYTAAYVFNDEFRLEDDNRFVDGEQREQTIGEPMDETDSNHPIDTAHSKPKAIIGEIEGILFVVFVQKSGELGRQIRLISARAANKKEAEAYLRSKYADYLE